MDTPPWKGIDEPDFMPKIRRTFAELLPGRLERGRRALDGLLAHGPAEVEADLEALRGVAHDLAGTARTMGAPEVGDHALSVTATLREARERDAATFLRWMEADDE